MVVGQGERWGACRRPPGAQIAGASSASGAVCLLGFGPREASCEALSPPGPSPPENGGEVTAAASVWLPLGLRAVVWGTWGPR